MKVSELIGKNLDYWAAKAENLAPYREEGHKRYWLVDLPGKPVRIIGPAPKNGMTEMRYSPSTDWSQGGPIIEREKILVQPIYSMSGTFMYWNAKKLERWYTYESESYLMAAMLCFVGARFGEDVDDS